MVLSSAAVTMKTPSSELGMADVPSRSLPMSFPSTTFRSVPVPTITTPLSVFPEIVLPAPAAVPPIVLSAAESVRSMPSPLPIATVPVASVPTRFPSTTVPDVPEIETPKALFEIRLPLPTPPMTLSASKTVTPQAIWMSPATPVASTPRYELWMRLSVLSIWIPEPPKLSIARPRIWLPSEPVASVSPAVPLPAPVPSRSISGVPEYPDSLGPSIVTGTVICGSDDRMSIVCTPDGAMLKVIADGWPLASAFRIAWRSVLGPESAFEVTG